jgi:hypothetical protein
MQPKSKTILIACFIKKVGDLTPLIEAYQDANILIKVEEFTGKPSFKVIEVSILNNVDALIIIGDWRFSPNTVLDGPFVTSENGHKIPASWLPVKNSEGLRKFAEVIKIVHGRIQEKANLAILSQWNPRYVHLSNRMETILENQIQTFKWTSDLIGRKEVVEALGLGLGLSIYVGHGRPVGWVGYYGMRANHFEEFSGNPIGSILSLCCRTASRRRTSLSFSESLILMGVTSASFGAVKDTKHTDNTRWVVRICETLTHGVNNLGDLLLKSAPNNEEAIKNYRIIGDPLAPLYSDIKSLLLAENVKTYP